MPWFKVDDGFAFHPKAIEAGNAALGLWVRAGAWCGANLTDGALPRHMIRTFGAQARDARRLVDVGLWVETDAGYQFHEWDAMQPSKADVEAERADNRERQKAYRERRRNGRSNSVSNGVTHSATNSTPSRPVPTLVKKTSSPDKPETFDEFWQAYPRKIGKGAAVKAYKAALKKASPAQIISGLETLRIQVAGKDQDFIPHASSWLNAERWEDEAPTQQAVVNGPWSKGFHS